MTRMVTLIVLFVLFPAFARAQASLAPQERVEFDAASVKLNRDGGPGARINSVLEGGRFIATNATVRQLVQLAYDVPSFRIDGLPGWATLERFDVNATAGRPVTDSQIRGALQVLLRSRFGLEARFIDKEMPVWGLVLRTPGRLGGQLRPASASDCTTRITGQPVPLPEPGVAPVCGTLQAGRDRITGRGVPLSDLASTLTPRLDRIVIDATQVEGLVDFELAWSPDPDDPDRPGLPTALQEQLGIRLDARRQQAEVLAIDKLNRPLPD